MLMQPDLKELAKKQTRELLGESSHYLSMPFSEQERLYREVYQASYNRLAQKQQSQLAKQTAYNPNDPTDPANFENRRIEQAGRLAGEFINEIDFPGFVRDLVLAVFRGNMEVQHQQMADFTTMLKATVGPITKFMDAVDDSSAFAYLAENEPDRFSFALPPLPPLDDENPEQPAQKPVLTDKQGNELDISDNAIKAKIMDAKIAMAREQRALLREVLLMGVTRMVVEKGRIDAACVFDIKAKEGVSRTGQRVNENVSTEGGNYGGSLGFLGFGGFGGGKSSTRRNTEITVSSAAGKTSTDLAAKITGSVSLEFKSDYFKLDNFAEMYRQMAAPQSPGQSSAMPPGATPAVLPAQKS
jgi:hypothetical protein